MLRPRTRVHCLIGCILGCPASEGADRAPPERRQLPHPDAHHDCECLTGELIQHREHLVAAAIAELVVYEVDGPDMVRMRGPQADDRAVLVIEPLTLLVALRKLQPFLAPEPLDLLVIDPPALDVEQLGDLAVAISFVLLRQPDYRQPERIVISWGRSILQGAPREADHPERPSLRRRELLACMCGGLTELRCGQALGFRWFRLSLRISLSSSSSATIFLSRAFSFAGLFISDNCDRPIPPNRLRQL